MVKISVAIITFNEERNIERCIRSVQPIADEIVVLDSYSTDGTKQICEGLGVIFLEHKFDGHIQQKNKVLELTNYDHVLSLDADEALSEKLLDSIIKVKSNWIHDGYVMPRLTSYCGKWIHHSGWYPDKKLRLFNKTKGEWTGSNPHDFYVVRSKDTFLLKGDLLHYSFYTEVQHLEQIEKFASIGAEVLYRRGKTGGYLHILLSPIVKFLSNYIFHGGFLDGKEGWVISKYSSYEKFLKYSKLKQLYRKS
jgi:glycosyltransferase involved in cell wall biosynthesis